MLSLPYIVQSYPAALPWDCEIRPQPKSATQSARLLLSCFDKKQEDASCAGSASLLHSHHFCCLYPVHSVSGISERDKMNGTMDGNYDHAPHDGSFMFTSESVGEGHPGE